MGSDDARYPDDLRYHAGHGWVRSDGTTVTCGMTWHAQDELGDIIGTRLPTPGDRLVAGGAYITVESIKTVVDLVSPVSGLVVATNADLEFEPGLINLEPYGRGWLVVVAVEREPAGLVDAAEYRALGESV